MSGWSISCSRIKANMAINAEQLQPDAGHSVYYIDYIVCIIMGAFHFVDFGHHPMRTWGRYVAGLAIRSVLTDLLRYPLHSADAIRESKTTF